jgi:hypothetical protein
LNALASAAGSAVSFGSSGGLIATCGPLSPAARPLVPVNRYIRLGLVGPNIEQ